MDLNDAHKVFDLQETHSDNKLLLLLLLLVLLLLLLFNVGCCCRFWASESSKEIY